MKNQKQNLGFLVFSLLGIIGFSFVYVTSFEDAEAQITISCPSISNMNIYDSDLLHREYNSRFECNYADSSQSIEGYLVANYVTNSNAGKGVDECSGKLDTTFYGGQMYSSSHRINVIFEYNDDEDKNLMTSGARSLLQQLESKNVAVSCSNQPTPTPTPGPSPDPAPEPPDDGIFWFFGFVILFVIVIATIVAGVKKAVSGGKSKNKTIDDKSPSGAVPIGTQSSINNISDSPTLKPYTPDLTDDLPEPLQNAKELAERAYNNMAEHWKELTDILPEPPVSPTEIAEEMAEKFQDLKEKDIEKYFLKVGDCIVKNEAGLHTGAAWEQKFGKIFVDRNSWGLVDYSTKEGMHGLTNDEAARKISEEFAKILADVGREKAIKIVGKPFSPIGILTFLISNFGTEITTPYICMAVHLKEL